VFHIAEMNRESLNKYLDNIRYWVAFIGVRRVISGAVSAVVGLFVLWLILRPSPAPIESMLPVATFAPSSTMLVSTPLTVHVAGAVQTPGVYQLPPRSRVVDALNAAGGPIQKADLEKINLAQLLVDTEQVYIPTRVSSSPAPTISPRHRPTTTIATQTPGGAGPGATTGVVNLNTATAAQLDALPGVGPATAKAILDYRESKGKFSKVEDLLNVTGIGAAKLAALKDFVTVEPS
jgi:competence protein ComEA